MPRPLWILWPEKRVTLLAKNTPRPPAWMRFLRKFVDSARSHGIFSPATCAACMAMMLITQKVPRGQQVQWRHSSAEEMLVALSVAELSEPQGKINLRLRWRCQLQCINARCTRTSKLTLFWCASLVVPRISILLYSRLQKVRIWIWDELRWFSFFSKLCSWGKVFSNFMASTVGWVQNLTVSRGDGYDAWTPRCRAGLLEAIVCRSCFFA